MTEFEIPKRASLDDIKDILKAYYLVGAHNEPVRTAEVKDTAQLGDKVSRQTNFLASLGVLSKEGRERGLTKDGESIAEALMAGNESLSKSLMRESLNEWKFTDKITGFLRMQEPEPVEEERLREFISANADSDDTRGQKALLELLKWADILDANENGYKISDGVGDEKGLDSGGKEQPQAEERGGRKTGKEKPITQEITDITREPNTSKKADSFSLNIEISGNDDPENVEKVIEAVRRALRKDLRED